MGVLQPLLAVYLWRQSIWTSFVALNKAHSLIPYTQKENETDPCRIRNRQTRSANSTTKPSRVFFLEHDIVGTNPESLQEGRTYRISSPLFEAIHRRNIPTAPDRSLKNPIIQQYNDWDETIADADTDESEKSAQR